VAGQYFGSTEFFYAFLFWIPAVIHAWGFVSDYKQKNKRIELLKQLMQNNLD
jgi:hypothetical protein